jgi:hypothetical protein
MKKIFMVFPVLIIVLSALFKFSKAYYKYWRELRCFKKMIKKNFIEYHIWVRGHPELRLDLDNFQSLCVPCHEALHKGERWGR